MLALLAKDFSLGFRGISESTKSEIFDFRLKKTFHFGQSHGIIVKDTMSSH